MSYKATIKNLFDLLQYIKHIFDKKPKILDKIANILVILFVLEQMFEERAEMSAQIIEFPMNRVRQVEQPTHRPAVQGYDVRPSVRIARKVIGWTALLITAYVLFFGQASALQPAEATNSATSSVMSKNYKYVTVMSGDSLWSIAEKYAPSGDLRDYIQEIIAMNNLSDSVVPAGMKLAIPLS